MTLMVRHDVENVSRPKGHWHIGMSQGPIGYRDVEVVVKHCSQRELAASLIQISFGGEPSR